MSNATAAATLVYRTAYGPDGGWPDLGPPDWQLRFDGSSVHATWERQRHYPFPPADVTGPVARGRVATATAPATTSVLLATPLQKSDPFGYVAWQCAPRAEITPRIAPGFRLTTAHPGSTMAVWRPEDFCPETGPNQTSRAALLAPVYGAAPVALGWAIPEPAVEGGAAGAVAAFFAAVLGAFLIGARRAR